jgi:hypothetical protein
MRGRRAARATITRAAACAGAAIATAAWAPAIAPARAASVTELDPGGTGVSAYGGWAAWSHEEQSAGDVVLKLRSPAGAVTTAQIAPAKGAFEVELGPAATGGVVAIYQRCSEPKQNVGCGLYELPLTIAGASERQLAIPGGGSDFRPAVWKNRIAFVRANAGDAGRPDSIYTWSGGSSVSAVAMPASRGAKEPEGGGRWPKGLTGEVSSLTLGPSQLAYVTDNVNGTFGETTLWYEPIGGHPELIDQETSGAGNVCAPAFLSPLLAGGWLYAYLHACDPSADPALDRLTRYRRGRAERARHQFIQHGDDSIDAAVIDGPGVVWSGEGVRLLSSVSWKRIPLPVAQTFCTRADPFC